MSIPDPLTVVVGATPPRELWPNTNAHKWTKTPHIAAMKAAAAVGVQNALVGHAWGWPGPIMLHIEIYWPTGQRRLDFDNALSSCKSAIDGVFGKIDANDRQIAGVLLTQDWDRIGDGYMVIQVEPHPANERQIA